MNTVVLRKFEERDIDFIYQCKNDEKLNTLIVGNWHPFTYEEAKQWVLNCIKGDRPDLKFWAVCTNDEQGKIVGWVCLSEINDQNHSACHHGIVIGDKEFQDGVAMFEAMLLSMQYAFESLKIHRLYGTCLSIHKITPYMLKSLGFSLEGRRKDACFKNNRYYDLLDYALIDTEYYHNKNEGRYKLSTLIKSFIKYTKE